MDKTTYRERVKYTETDTFKYKNVNPKNRITTDCIVRAVVFALGRDYNEVYKEMFELSIKTGYALNDKKLLEKYMKQLGIKKQNQPKKDNGKKYTGKEFAKTFCEGTYICFIGGHHASVCHFGKFYDIWDCTDKCIGTYYQI